MNDSVKLLLEVIASTGGIMAITQFLFKRIWEDKWMPIASLILGLAIGQILFFGLDGILFGLIATFSGNAVYDNLVAFKKK